MKKALLLTALIVLSAPALAADKNGQFFSRGLGAQLCQNYVAEKTKGSASYFLYRSWLNGYLSAYNQFSQETYDIAPNATMDGLANAVESVCRKYPERKFWTAAFGVTQALWPKRMVLKSVMVSATSGKRTVTLYRATMKEVQQALKSKGYKIGRPDGMFGKRTQQALAAYQKKQKLPVTGLPDPATRVKLLP